MVQGEKFLVIPEGKICDYIDGKFRNDTPEEYVRQNIEKRLVNEHEYRKEEIRVEFTLSLGSGKPRADIVIFPEGCASFTQENIKIIIECKKENIEISSRKDGIGQLKSYMSACPNCEWGMWTNGKQKEVFRKVLNEKGEVVFEDYNDIPSANGSIDDVDRPKRTTLKNAVEDNLLFVFRTCHNHIYVTDGMQKQPAFFELLKVIFCKIEDEKNIPNALEFYATSKERGSPDGQLTVTKRISKIFELVKRKFPKIFDPNDEIKLQPRSLSYIVSELQKYSLLKTNIDIKGKAYEELVGANLRGDRGEFFTPRNVMHMTVEMLNPAIEEKVLDSSCGTGGFLVVAMTKVIQDLKEEMEQAFGKPEKEWGNEEDRVVHERVSNIAKDNFYGFDINPDLVKATKMNMVMNNDGSGNILRNDSLLPPHLWDQETKKKFAVALQVDPSDITSHRDLGHIDVIVTNPPFGSKIPIKDSHILEQFDLGRIWEKRSEGGWRKTERLQSSVAPEQLFVERCMQFLKPGGRMGIVLPDSILSSPGLGYIRQWLLEVSNIIASVDLHPDTFQPRNGTQTSVLILQKKTKEEVKEQERTGLIRPYEVFTVMADKIGHDKRGTPIFKRDKDGEEILVERRDTEGRVTKEKEIDDQTLIIPKVFVEWKRQQGISW